MQKETGCPVSFFYALMPGYSLSLIHISVVSLDLPESGDLSAAFLGAAVLELTGRTGESPWFDFLNQLRRELPVVQKQAYLPADGTLTDQLTAEQTAQVLKWRQWSYYKLMYKEID